MPDPADRIDADMAAFERLRPHLDQAIAACQAEHDAGRIGYEAYRVTKARQEKLLAAVGVLQRRPAEALDPLTGTQASQAGRNR